MAPRATDHSGKRFGRLIVLHRVHPTTQRAKLPHWACECDCGNLTIVRADKLTRGETRSCGCLRHELFGNAAERGERVPPSEVTGVALRVLQHLLQRAPASPTDVARAMDMTPNAVWIAFSDLRKAGRIELHQVVGRRRVYRVIGTTAAPAPPIRPAVYRRPRDASALLADVLGYSAPPIAPLPTAHYLGDD